MDPTGSETLVRTVLCISLSQDAVKNKELYVKNTAGILEEAGLFLITSCNWTKVGCLKKIVLLILYCT